MTAPTQTPAVIPPPPSRGLRLLSLLWHDKFAFFGALFVLLVVLFALFGPMMFGDVATKMNLRARNMPPFSLEKGWLFFLGADALGRSILARLIVAGQNTMAVAAAAVFAAMIIGGTLGMLAGFIGGWFGNVVMRLADMIMSFPSLLIAMIVLYMLEPRVANLVVVLGITRMPIYMRTARAEVLEIRERLFVSAARVMGASHRRIVGRHIAPIVLPTLTTIAALDFAFVMLAESSLSFLGIGIQPPEISWGLMVSQGKNYLQIAWWLSFFPGLAIMLTALSLNMLSSWVRIALDPVQRWRLEVSGGGND
jgi:peptide/nickel transport system permease protein